MNVYLTNNMETKLSFYDKAKDKDKYAKLTILFISYYLYYYYYYYNQQIPQIK